jgi:hypothetical protein
MELTPKTETRNPGIRISRRGNTHKGDSVTVKSEILMKSGWNPNEILMTPDRMINNPCDIQKQGILSILSEIRISGIIYIYIYPPLGFQDFTVFLVMFWPLMIAVLPILALRGGLSC